MLIKTLPVGMLSTNCYVVTDEIAMKCVIIDPGAESNAILDYVESNRITPEAVFLTHGHFDHHMALDAVLKATNVPVYLSGKEVDRNGRGERHKVPYDDKMRFCKDGDIIPIGNLTFEVMETPGHSPGSLTFVCENALFTGDTLFCGDCGRTDLDGGSRDTILASLRRLAGLKGDYEVYPGHDETTTLDCERMNNLDMKIALGVMN